MTGNLALPGGGHVEGFRPGMRDNEQVAVVTAAGIRTETPWGSVVAMTNGAVLEQIPDSVASKAARRPRRSGFDRHQPRDRQGRWVETGAEVRWGAHTGRVVSFHPETGRFRVERPDGNVVTLLRSQITATNAPRRPEPAGDAQAAAPRPAAPQAAPAAGGHASAPPRASEPDGQALPPVPEPEDAPTLRPDLTTEQRKAINGYGFADDADQPDRVRTAAAAVRDKQPLTAAQAEALADALRARGATESAARKRSLERAAGRLETVSTALSGIAPQNVPAHEGVTKTTAEGVTDGDTIALPGRGGAADMFKVVSTELWYGQHKMVLERPDGTREERLIHPSTLAYILPDAPAPEPVAPDGPKEEHLTADRILPGDVIRVHTGQEVEVVSTRRKVNGDWEFQVRAPGDESDTTSFGVIDPDGLPTVTRIRRGPASVDQPYDSVMPPEREETATIGSLQVGDRIAISTSTVPGTVLSITREDDRLILRVRDDDGMMRTHQAYDPDIEILRLARADDNAAARIEIQLENGRRRKNRAEISHQLQRAERVAYQLAAIRMSGAEPNDVRMARQDHEAVVEAALTLIAKRIVPNGSDAEHRLIRERLHPIFAEQQQRIDAQIEEAARNPHQLEGETWREARVRTLEQYRVDPPLADYARVAGLLEDLHDRLRQVPGERASGLPELPDIPEGMDLQARANAYRGVIGGRFGQTRVSRSLPEPMSLADLEAGTPPRFEDVDNFIPDRAADDGPGEVAMRHLAAVRAMGGDLRRRLEMRMEAERLSLADEAALRERLKSALGRQNEGFTAMQNQLAQEAGYADWAALLQEIEEARQGGYDARVRRLMKLHNKIINDAGENNPVALEINEIVARLAVDMGVRTNDYRTMATLRRRHALELIAEARGEPMGGELDIHMKRGRSDNYAESTVARKFPQLAGAMEIAAESYPAAWVEQLRDRPIRLTYVKRGYQIDSPRETEIALSQTAYADGTPFAALDDPRDNGFGRVAVHELGHAMEYHVPGLREAEEALLWDRSSDGEIGSRTRQSRTQIYGGNSNEMGWKDQFPEHYTGKDYSGRAYEVFTTAAESLLAGSPYLDDDLTDWLFGVMVLI
jgi:hypothetical protein